MYFGSIIAAGFGDPDKHLATFLPTVIRSGTAIRTRLEASSGFGGSYFGLYINSLLADVVYLEEGVESVVETGAPGVGEVSVRVLRHGDIQAASMPIVSRNLESATADAVTIAWDWDPQEIGIFTAAGAESLAITASALTGITYTNTSRASRRTRSKLKYKLYDVAGNVRAEILRGDEIVATTATNTPPVLASLTAQNGSGIAGTLELVSATDEEGEIVFRFPESMRVKRDASDPPSTVVATVLFDEADSTTYTDADLSPDTYYYRLEAVSDTNDTGTESASTSVAVPGPPAPPTDLAYSSGDASATVVSFTASATGGATYRAYIQEIGEEYLDLENIAATAGAGSTTLTLPAITGYAGTIRVIVRAVTGIEEENADVIEIEYDASGNRVAPRPNAPMIQGVTVATGDSLTVSGVYDPAEEAAAATLIRLKAATPGGSYVSVGTGALTLDGTNGLYTGSVSTSSLSNGWYNVALYAETAAGVSSVEGSDPYLVYIDDANISSPTGTFTVSRG